MFSFFQSKSEEAIVSIQLLPNAVVMVIPSNDGAANVLVRPATQNSHSEVLKELVLKHKLQGAFANTVLSPKAHKAYLIERPTVPTEEQSDAAKWRIRDMLDYAVEEAVVGAFDFPNEALRGRGAQLNVRVAHRQEVQHTLDVLGECDLQPASIVTADLALASLIVGSDSYQAVGTVLLYLGADYGLFVYAREQQLYLAREFEFPFASLNELSQQEQRLGQLTLEVQRSFDYLESQMGLAPPKKIMLSAPDARLPLANMIGGALGIEVENFSAAANADDAEAERPHAMVQQGLFAVGALSNHLEPEHSVDLYTEEFHPPGRQLGLPHVAASLVLAVLLVIVGAIWQGTSLTTAQQAQQQSQTTLDAVRADLTELAEREKNLVLDPALKKRLEALKRESSAYSSLLDELQAKVPENEFRYSEFLESLAKHRPEKLWLTKFSLTSSGGHMDIEGVTLEAREIPAYLEGLQTDTLFAAKTFGTLSIEKHVDSEGHYVFGLRTVSRRGSE